MYFKRRVPNRHPPLLPLRNSLSIGKNELFDAEVVDGVAARNLQGVEADH